MTGTTNANSNTAVLNLMDTDLSSILGKTLYSIMGRLSEDDDDTCLHYWSDCAIKAEQSFKVDILEQNDLSTDDIDDVFITSTSSLLRVNSSGEVSLVDAGFSAPVLA